MCGIAAIMGLQGQQVLRHELAAMCDVMVHRGPDDQGYFTDVGIGLGHRRLSIIDLDKGSQPISNEDGTVWVVLNGEIYNFRELTRELVSKGHRFRSATDTEVIVHLYEELGEACVERLRGMFAFVLWDTRQRKLLVARDRLGIKPLFYGEFDNRLVVASELKAILQLPEVERALDWSAVADVMSSLSSPDTQSVVRGVRKLPPAHRLTVQMGKTPRIERYWDVNFAPDHSRGLGSFIDELRALLTEAVKLHMVSDVPVGAFLSGGLDSSSVVATMAGVANRPIKTFSIGFEEASYNEAPHARRVAERLGTEHQELILKPDVLDIVDDLAWYLDEPFGDSSAIPTFMVSRLASQQVTVVLSGDGGDELFAGYDHYGVEQRERRMEQRIPGVLRSLAGRIGRCLPQGVKGRNFLRHMAYTGARRYLDAASLLNGDDLVGLFDPAVSRHLERYDPWTRLAADLKGYDDDWLSALQYFDLKHYLPLDILTKVDRMSMAHSIEARVPLLDHKFVEFAATIPAEFRYRGGSTKYILKRAMQNLLPRDLIHRKKQGFAIPLGAWFGGSLNGFVRDLLFSHRARQRGIFDVNAVGRLLKLHEGGRNMDLQLWTLISFELWCRSFLDCVPGRPGLHGARREMSGYASAVQ